MPCASAAARCPIPPMPSSGPERKRRWPCSPRSPAATSASFPFGGGTSVVGGVDRRRTARPLPSTCNNSPMFLNMSPISATAAIEAGILGPALETQLNAQGFTLGHFPSVFPILQPGQRWPPLPAARVDPLRQNRGADQSLRLALPGGASRHPRGAPAALPDPLGTSSSSAPRASSASSPRPRCAWPMPRHGASGYLSLAFPAGVEAAAEMMQREARRLRPPPLRRTGTTHQPRLSLRPSRPGSRYREGGGWYLTRRGVSLDTASSSSSASRAKRRPSVRSGSAPSPSSAAGAASPSARAPVAPGSAAATRPPTCVTCLWITASWRTPWRPPPPGTATSPFTPPSATPSPVPSETALW